jgi:hypothetical protein
MSCSGTEPDKKDECTSGNFMPVVSAKNAKKETL